MTAWIGLGSAEGVQPANGTPMRSRLWSQLCVGKRKANMDITLEHPIHTKTQSSEKENERRERERERERERGNETNEDGKTKKNQEKVIRCSGSVG